MTKARENSDYTGLQGDLAGLQTNITAGDTAARAGRKNLIINGDNRISQRGTYTSALDFVHNSYLLDRWIAGKSGGSIDGTITHSSDTVNGAVCKTQKYIVTTGHAGSWIGGRQILEFPETFIGRTLTVSAWVKSNSDDARILLWDVNSGTNTAIATQAHTGGGAWEYLSSTGTVMAGTTSLTLYMATLTTVAGAVTTSTGDYIEFTNVQIELGSVATDFEHRSYGEILADCQRFYEVTQGGTTEYAETTGNYLVSVPFRVKKRASPTLTVIAADENCASNVQVTDAGTNMDNKLGARVYANNRFISGLKYWYARFSADAEL
jgi:hypothetical protein